MLVALVGGAAEIEPCRLALRWLQEAAPKAQLTLLVETAAVEAVQKLARGGEIMTDPGGEAGAEADRWLLEEIRKGRFEAAVFFTPFGRSPYRLAYLAYLAGVPVRVGQAQEWGGSVLNRYFKEDEASACRPSAQRHLELLQKAFPEGNEEQNGRKQPRVRTTSRAGPIRGTRHCRLE